jgi:hypothetical protein
MEGASQLSQFVSSTEIGKDWNRKTISDFLEPCFRVGGLYALETGLTKAASASPEMGISEKERALAE